MITISMTVEQYESADEDHCGYCRECGAEHFECEPDARKYPCEECGALAVYGAEECLMYGMIQTVDEDEDEDE